MSWTRLAPRTWHDCCSFRGGDDRDEGPRSVRPERDRCRVTSLASPLAEGVGVEVPVVDITLFLSGTVAGKRHVADEVRRACETIGFLTLVGHGVSPPLILEMSQVSREFFDQLPGEKLKARSSDPSRGYRPGDESLAYSLGQAAPADLKETLDIGPIDVPDEDYYIGLAGAPYFVPNVWPREPMRLRATWTAYYREMERLAETLMRIFAVALQLEEDFFGPMIDRHITRMRAINYPEQPQAPYPGQLRCGAHSDYGTLTILHIDDAPGGLQVFTPAGQWVDVHPVPGSLVVNLGDLMMHWTNDRWRSTLHRVANPPRDAVLGTRRQSIVFFHQPNYDALITCLPSCCSDEEPAKYPPITSGEHRRAKFGRTVIQPVAGSVA